MNYTAKTFSREFTRMNANEKQEQTPAGMKLAPRPCGYHTIESESIASPPFAKSAKGGAPIPGSPFTVWSRYQLTLTRKPCAGDDAGPVRVSPPPRRQASFLRPPSACSAGTHSGFQLPP